ncbi:Thioredoxin-like protein Clot [Thelohanellus kitauei]|uniref:Thioredoxin domain-containing protein 17 n=1 Tax=Thelohanellus kitauei TaxID=669202 RepID=A0A0C2MNE8_THEKT|nr:Thioredoxin-like protein Clot [Thelohanellus kitauei]
MPIEHLDDHEMLKEKSEFMKGKRNFMVFESSLDPSTGTFWCPDCTVFDKMLATHIDKLPEDVFLYRFNVGNRKSWKDPGNPIRHGVFLNLKVTSVPSLVDIDKMELFGDVDKMDSEALAKLILSECSFT